MKYRLSTNVISAVAFLVSLTMMGWSCDPCDGWGAEASTVLKCVQSQTKEDVLAIPEIKNYLNKHKVYISLTSSPKRISKILPVLQSLDLKLVTHIFLVLPLTFQNKPGADYLIPEEIKKFEKLQILRIKEDLGPITKLLPAIAYVNNSEENRQAGIKFVLDTPAPLNPADPNAIVITIDDDVVYYRGAISQFIKHAILKDSVVTGGGYNVAHWGIDRTRGWPQQEIAEPLCRLFPLSSCDLIEGWAGVAYKAKHVNVSLMKKLSVLGKDQGNKSCFISDDLVIGFGLAKAGVQRLMVRNQYAYEPIPLDIGFQDDALHLGGDAGKDYNYQKYPDCFNNYLKDFR